jgi:hypothetical protein
MKTYNRMIILTMTYYKKRGLLTPPWIIIWLMLLPALWL